MIVNYNGARLLPACLDAVAHQVAPFDIATWVVDNGSVDGSRRLLGREYPWVRVLTAERNLGFAGGNNLALSRVESPYVALLNNDAVPEATWARELVAPLERDGGLGATTSKILFLPRFLPLSVEAVPFSPSGGDERVLGCKLRMVSVDGSDVTDEVIWDHGAYGVERDGAGAFRWLGPTATLLVPAPKEGGFRVGVGVSDARGPVVVSWGAASRTVDGSRAETVDIAVSAAIPRVDVINNAGGYVTAAGFGGDRAFRTVDDGTHDAPTEVFNACGAAAAFRTAALRDAGHFDDDFFLYYEDTDLSWRLRARGWRIEYIPTAVVRHVHSATSVEWSPLFTFHVERNRLLMLLKNASGRLAWSAVRSYILDCARSARDAFRSRRDADLALLRARVVASFLRLLPRTLAKRRGIARNARTSRRDLEAWLGRGAPDDRLRR